MLVRLCQDSFSTFLCWTANLPVTTWLPSLLFASPLCCQRLTAGFCRWWGISPRHCLLAATIACAPLLSPRTSRRKKVPRSLREGSVQTHKQIWSWEAKRTRVKRRSVKRITVVWALPGYRERRRHCPPQSTSRTFLWDDTWRVRFGVLRARQTKASPQWITTKHLCVREQYSLVPRRAHSLRHSLCFVTGGVYYAWSSCEPRSVSYPGAAPLLSLWRGRRWCTVWWT